MSVKSNTWVIGCLMFTVTTLAFWIEDFTDQASYTITVCWT